MGKLFAQYHGKRICIGEFHTKRFELEHKAKEMEKEQMRKIYSSPITTNEDGNFVIKSFEQYYNETYGGNKWNYTQKNK